MVTRTKKNLQIRALLNTSPEVFLILTHLQYLHCKQSQRHRTCWRRLQQPKVKSKIMRYFFIFFSPLQHTECHACCPRCPESWHWSITFSDLTVISSSNFLVFEMILFNLFNLRHRIIVAVVDVFGGVRVVVLLQIRVGVLDTVVWGSQIWWGRDNDTHFDQWWWGGYKWWYSWW